MTNYVTGTVRTVTTTNTARNRLIIDHKHEWTPDAGNGAYDETVDTNPPLYTYWCRSCDAVTHDPKTGRVCNVWHYR